MAEEIGARLDKDTARAVIEDRLRRVGMRKGELARVLYMSPSVFSRKLGARYPFERFTAEEIAQIADLLGLTGAQHDLLHRCYGHAGEIRVSRPAVPRLPEPPSRTNLPAQLTSFIGRERERVEVERLLASARLVTLTGAGGCGKTRLALELAAGIMARYPDGVWLVELAGLPPEVRGGGGIETADLAVAQAVTAAVGVRETAALPLVERLVDALRHRRMLLVLDNCEHVIGACARLAEVLLRACLSLTILATSREPLAIPGEVTLRVPSLALPERPALPARSLSSAPALEKTALAPEPSLSPLVTDGGERQGVGPLTESELLLLDRVRSLTPGFSVTERNRDVLARICRAVDGIPLAIELAAARTPALSLEQIATRLDDSMRLLSGGSRTALPRQQTLAAAMNWSHDLLSEPERAVFRRLSVFSGGFTLEAAEDVADGEASQVVGCREQEDVVSPVPSPLSPFSFLDVLTQLVQKSLVVVDEQDVERRYRLLEPVRQYAEQRLREAGETMETRRRHRDYFLALAERAEPSLIDAGRAYWMAHLDQEHDNLRAALAWSINEDPIGDGEAALRLAAALWRFWQEHGYLGEGRRWLEVSLARAVDAPLAARAKALIGAGVLTREQGDYARAAALYTEALHYFRSLHDRRGEAAALNSLGMVWRDQGDFARARELYEQALHLRHELGDRQSVAATLNNLALLLGELGEYEEAVHLHEESLAIKRAFGDRRGIAASLNNLGMLTRARGDLARAVALYTDSLALFRELGDIWGVAVLLNNLGNAMRDRGDIRRAAALYTESLELRRNLGDKPGIAWCLEGLAAVALAEVRAERGAMLLGAAEALREAIGATVPLAERTDRERTLATARAALDEFDFSVAWARGRAMTLDDAITRALEVAHLVA